MESLCYEPQRKAADYCSRSVNQLITPSSAALHKSETSIMTLARLNGTPTARSAVNKMITRPATTRPDMHSAFGIPRFPFLISNVVLNSCMASQQCSWQ